MPKGKSAASPPVAEVDALDFEQALAALEKLVGDWRPATSRSSRRWPRLSAASR
jgi:hypothetical protein